MSERKALSLAALLTIGLSSTVSANPLASVNAYSCGNVPNPALNKLTVSAERPASLPSYRPDAASTVKLRIIYPSGNGTVEVDHCGGTVIDNEWVVTAGHCVAADSNWSHIEVIAGDQHLEGQKAIRRTANEAICHSGFRYETLENDIALIRLNKPLPDRITPMRLDNHGFAAVRPGDQAIGRGWPVTGTHQGDRLLNQTRLNIRNVSLQSYITATTVGGIGGLCRGESGGPLVARSAGGRVLAGVLSGIQPGTQDVYGQECMIPSYEMYFTPVAAHRNWIDRVRSVCTGGVGSCTGGGAYAFSAPAQQSFPSQSYGQSFAAAPAYTPAPQSVTFNSAPLGAAPNQYAAVSQPPAYVPTQNIQPVQPIQSVQPQYVSVGDFVSYSGTGSVPAPQTYVAQAPTYAPQPYTASPSFSAPSYAAPSFAAPSITAPSFAAPSFAAPSFAAPSYQSVGAYDAPSYEIAAAPSYGGYNQGAYTQGGVVNYGSQYQSVGSYEGYSPYGYSFLPGHARTRMAVRLYTGK